MASLFADRALLPTGWTRQVRLGMAGDRIERVETGVRPRPEDRRVGSVLPGFVNAHSHAFQRALAGRTEHRATGSADTFWSWRSLMYRLAGRLDGPRLGAVAAQLYAEMVAAGYTTAVEFHYLLGGRADADRAETLLDALIGAADRAGIRLLYLPVLYEYAGFGEATPSREQQGFVLPLDSFLDHVDAAGRRTGSPHAVGIGVHSLRAVTPGSLSAVAAHAAGFALPMHLHIAEQPGEVEDCLGATGRRPVDWLLDHCAVDDRWTLVHATHVDDGETRDLAAAGATVCLCPSTEGNLGDGLFPLAGFLDAGGRIAIGSDSHVTVDPFEELRWLEYGARLATGTRNVAATEDGRSTGASLVHRVIDGGAHSAGTRHAGLVAGGHADLLVLDDDSAVLAGHEEQTLLDALVFSGQPVPIRDVMVAGRWQVERGHHRQAGALLDDYRRALDGLFDAEPAP